MCILYCLNNMIYSVMPDNVQSLNRTQENIMKYFFLQYLIVILISTQEIKTASKL